MHGANESQATGPACAGLEPMKGERVPRLGHLRGAAGAPMRSRPACGP